MKKMKNRQKFQIGEKKLGINSPVLARHLPVPEPGRAATSSPAKPRIDARRRPPVSLT